MVFSVLWIPVLIANVLFMPFGAFLYSDKGLGKLWLEAIGKTSEEIKSESNNMALYRGEAFLSSVGTIFLFAVLVASIGVTTFIDLLLLVFVVYFIVFLIRLKNSLLDGNF